MLGPVLPWTHDKVEFISMFLNLRQDFQGALTPKMEVQGYKYDELSFVMWEYVAPLLTLLLYKALQMEWDQINQTGITILYILNHF